MHSSERSKQILQALLYAAAGFTLGVVCGRLMPVESRPGFEFGVSESRQRQADVSTRAGRLEEKISVFASRLHQVMAARTSTECERAIASIADGLDTDEIGEAVAALERLHVPSRQDVMGRLLERWGEIDPERAMAYALSLVKPMMLSRIVCDAVAAVLYGWLDKEPGAAERWVVNAPEGAAKERGLQILAQYFAGDDLPRALRIANQINFDKVDSEELAQTLFDGWTKRAPAEAAAYAVQLADENWRTDALRAVVTRWTQEDPATALSWARSIPGQQLQRRGLGDTNDTPLEAGLAEWAQADISAAMAWVSALPEGDERAVLASTLREEFAYYTEIDPHTAKLLRAMPDTGPEANLFLQFCANQAATQNPQRAVEWLQSEEDPEIRSDILRGLMGSLTGDQLSRVLRAIDPQTLRLDLLAGNILGKGISDPETFAASAIAETNDPAILKLIATSWLREDREKGRAWLDQSALSAKVKQEILSEYGP